MPRIPHLVTVTVSATAASKFKIKRIVNAFERNLNNRHALCNLIISKSLRRVSDQDEKKETSNHTNAHSHVGQGSNAEWIQTFLR